MMFEEKYFIHSKSSNYINYTKRKFTKLAEDLINNIPLDKTHRILDFGCATGGLIKELKEKGFSNLKGTDISYWSIEYGKKKLDLVQELEYHNINLLTDSFDILFLLDVLEHVPTIEEIKKILTLNQAPKVVMRVPISAKEGGSYVFPISRHDITHIHCHTKTWWINLFKECGYKLDFLLDGKTIFDSEGVFAGVFTKCR